MAVALEPLFELRHNNAVFGVAFSSDGKRLASASLDNTVKIWLTADGTHIGTLKGHGDGVAFVSFLKDGRLVTASLDKTLRVWSAEGAAQLAMSGHQDYLACGAVAASELVFASGAFDNSVRLWDAVTGNQLTVLNGHTAAVQAVAFSSDSTLLASGGNDQGILLWSVEERSPAGKAAGHSAAVEAIAFAPREKVIASAGGDGFIRLWNYEGQTLDTVKTKSERLKSLTWSPNGRMLITGGTEGIVRLWDMGERRELTSVAAHRNTVMGAAFSPDGQTVATAGFDRTIRVFGCKPS